MVKDFEQSPETQHFKNRFKELLTQGKIRSQRDFCESIEYSESSLSEVMRGKRNLPKYQLSKFKELYEQTSQNRSISLVPEKTKNGNITYIPSRAQAGYLDNFADQSFMEELPKFHLPGFDDCSVAITVEGDSMYPSYSNGDLILCKDVANLSYIRFGEPYLILMDDGAVVKYVLDHKNKTQFILISENELYKPYTVDKDRIKKVWLVKGKISKSVGRRSPIEKKLKELEEKIYELLEHRKK